MRTDLRERVVAHKQVYFAAAWASYQTAVPGTFRLLPSAERLVHLAKDYAAMRPMYFGDPPSWPEIVGTLQDLETGINQSSMP